MNDEEKAALKAEIMKEIQYELKGTVIREDVSSVLSSVRNKWFRDQIPKNNPSPMYAVFGSVKFWVVWETIRKLTCFICGVSYVRNLGKNNDFANYAADTLCETVYRLRQEYIEKNK